MFNKSILWIAFIIMVAIQWAIATGSIYSHERILKTGTAFKFKIQPLDPNDPFRGKYISLRFALNTVSLSNTDRINSMNPVYVTIEKDNDGFAKFGSASTKTPASTQDYLQVSLTYMPDTGTRDAQVELPFDRFYMDEYKAPSAEKIYTQALLDTTKTTYALVYIKSGEGLIKNVFIGDTSIVDLLKSQH